MRGSSCKFLVKSLTLGVVLAVGRPGVPAIVSATGNSYQWTKQQDHDLVGGSYTSVASSADGSHLIVGSRDGGEGYNQASPLYVSGNYGATWQNVTETADDRIRNYWSSVDVSADGQTMVAASSLGVNLDNLNSVDGKIFISHNGGTSWTDISPNGASEWHSIAISGNGSKIVAIADDDTSQAYISTNGGTSWTTSAVDNVMGWESLSISDNGNKVLIGGENSQNASSFIDISDDGGANWTNVSPDNGNMVFTTRTTMSASGDKIAVSTYGYDGSDYYDTVSFSSNDGTSWTTVTPNAADPNNWSALAISGNGTMLSVQDNNDVMYLSSNNGASWTLENPGAADSDTNYWRSIDFNNSGSRIITASESFAYLGYNSTLDSAPEEETPAAPSVNIANAESGKAVVVTTPDGTTITCHSPVKESGLSAQDGAYSYPLGLVDFCFSGAEATNAVSLVFVTDLKPNQVAVRKYNPSTQQYATITNATVTETTHGGQHALLVSYTIADNGPLDTNPTTGEISDPVGLAVLDTNSPGAPNTGVAAQSATPFVVAGIAGFGILATVAITYRRKLREIVRTSK